MSPLCATRCGSVTLALLLIFSSWALARSADEIVGDWRTKGGESIIHIERSGNTYSGRISWLKKPADKNGAPLTDTKNPDQGLRARPILGLTLLRGFKFDGKEAWEDGKIYDPKSGKDYDCTMKIDDNGNLAVRGFVGISLIGRTEVWRRAGNSSE